MVKFIDSNRKRVFVIDEMHINSKEYFDLSFMIKINYSFFWAEKTISCEKEKFVNFKNDLMNLYVGKNGDLFFSDYERNIDINMKKDEVGHIVANVTLRDFHNMLESHVFFEYVFDQSFLPELIEEIETTLEELR